MTRVTIQIGDVVVTIESDQAEETEAEPSFGFTSLSSDTTLSGD